KIGWIFTLDYPSYVPFVTYANNRALRREIALAAGRKAFQDNTYNNEKNIQHIVQLRFQRAQLLAYDTHAHFVLEDRMAQQPTDVQAFFNDWSPKRKPYAVWDAQDTRDFRFDMHSITQ